MAETPEALKRKRSEAGKKAWVTIRKKRAEEAARNKSGGKKYRSIDDDGSYGADK